MLLPCPTFWDTVHRVTVWVPGVVLELPWSSDRVLGGLLLYLVPSCGLRAARWQPTITKFGYGPPPKPVCDVEAWDDEC